ncbi:hypothetical protein DNTS_016607 [Danionella cerebrum]|uniref:Uncharacterized protein n=1 Tax=Danionella cerebrum TaxID=2873325 RepID=A0A553R5H8_9TELE|nr:hypothetical protein DNTS_016607 [Danionella translucida]
MQSNVTLVSAAVQLSTIARVHARDSGLHAKLRKLLIIPSRAQTSASSARPKTPRRSSLKCVDVSYSGQGGGSGSTGGGGDEDYEIPPITPPNHPEPPLLHLMDPESSYLCHSIPHNGLLNPYSYPELPALMMSNMLAQDGHLLSGQMPTIEEHHEEHEAALSRMFLLLYQTPAPVSPGLYGSSSQGASKLEAFPPQLHGARMQILVLSRASDALELDF